MGGASGWVEAMTLIHHPAGQAFAARMRQMCGRLLEPARREEALDLLTPVLLRRSRLELAPLVPTLRWLSGQRELGADSEAWWRWLEQRRDGKRDVPDQGGGLDLPETSGARDANVRPGDADAR